MESIRCPKCSGNIKKTYKPYLNETYGDCEKCNQQYILIADIPTESVNCIFCDNRTTMISTKQCHPCWEINHRLDDWLKLEPAQKRVLDVLSGTGNFKVTSDTDGLLLFKQKKYQSD